MGQGGVYMSHSKETGKYRQNERYVSTSIYSYRVYDNRQYFWSIRHYCLSQGCKYWNRHSGSFIINNLNGTVFSQGIYLAITAISELWATAFMCILDDA